MDNRQETALYFPFMRAPQKPWFTQVLLYWDQVATIVPRQFTRQTGGSSLGEYMDELKQQNLIETIDPGLAMEQVRDPFMRELSRHTDAVSQLTYSQQRTRVHVGKASSVVFKRLERLGLANQDAGPWWSVEQRVAKIYMACLAGAMCSVREGMVPVTDNVEEVADFQSPVGDTEQRLRYLRYVAVMDALPVPSKPVAVKDLRSFKDAHYEQLLNLRRSIDFRLADIAMIDDGYLRQIKCEAACREVREAVADLREDMNRRRGWKVGLCGIGGVMTPALAAASGMVSGGGALLLGLLAGGGLVSIGTAAYEAAEIIKAPSYDRRSPFVYAALAQAL